MVFGHRIAPLAFLLVAVFLLSGCAETQFVSHYAKKLPWPGTQESAGSYKVGNPYKVENVWYYPEESYDFTETGIASWYGPNFHGKRTANGEIYDKNELTAAHRTLQMPSLVRVTNLENGRSVVLRVNDRGPFKRGRVIDVSQRAADLLDFRNKGTARVRVQVLSQESRQIAEAARRGLDTSRITLADLRRMETTTGTPRQTTPAAYTGKPVRVAALETANDALPESLQTPTITVEELSSAPKSSTWGRSGSTQSAPRAESPDMTGGHLHAGRFMPEPVVTQEPVTPTGIFVQAGSFTVYQNAENIKRQFSSLAPVTIEPVTVKGRQFYRVKIGPIATVERADMILDEVVRAGNGTAKVIKR